jgi:phenylpropionate dioxygenase-like ring-hydroxylating dioxygenase large terminal subunit
MVAGVVVEGRELALWRAQSGEAHLWQDRCPHRGMRLSFGFVRGDRLGCLYHGWQYDEAGRCRYIPAHPELEVPATISIPVCRVSENAGILWASFHSQPIEAPRWPEATPVRSLYLDAPLAKTLRVASSLATRADDARDVGNTKLIENDGDTLLVAGQIVSAQTSALHIALLSAPTGETRARQRHHAIWATRVRRAVEGVS